MTSMAGDGEVVEAAGGGAGPEALTARSNPYLDFYREFCAQHPGELTRVFDPALAEDERARMYAALDVGVAMVRGVDVDVHVDVVCVLTELVACGACLPGCRSIRGPSRTSARCASSSTLGRYEAGVHRWERLTARS
jgi:hypothetical protein